MCWHIRALLAVTTATGSVAALPGTSNTPRHATAGHGTAAIHELGTSWAAGMCVRNQACMLRNTALLLRVWLHPLTRLGSVWRAAMPNPQHALALCPQL